jgi:curved DNA-binding protein CbpA
MRNPYDSLAVPQTATADDIKKSFRQLAKKLHPDTNKSDPSAAVLFAEVNAAHEILGDEVKRRAFDRGEIDAAGKPNREPRLRRYHIGDIATRLTIVTLMIASTQVIVRLTPLSEIYASSDQRRVAQQGDTSAGKAATATPTGQNPIRAAVEPQLDHRQIELLIARSWKLMSEGDVEAARALLLRAAMSRDSRAALALGSTYDPIMLAILEARGAAPDAFLARIWYRRAIVFGSEERNKTAASASRRPPRRPAFQSAHNPREDIMARRGPNVL